MNITEVRIKLINDTEDRLKAFCSITLDSEFVVRDLKIIDGPKGLFVAMPSRRLTARCGNCSCRIEARARFCGSCGTEQKDSAHDIGHDAQPRQFADIAHPINGACRAKIESAVLTAYGSECERFARPGDVDQYGDLGPAT